MDKTINKFLDDAGIQYQTDKRDCSGGKYYDFNNCTINNQYVGSLSFFIPYEKGETEPALKVTYSNSKFDTSMASDDMETYEVSDTKGNELEDILTNIVNDMYGYANADNSEENNSDDDNIAMFESIFKENFFKNGIEAIIELTRNGKKFQYGEDGSFTGKSGIKVFDTKDNAQRLELSSIVQNLRKKYPDCDVKAVNY